MTDVTLTASPPCCSFTEMAKIEELSLNSTNCSPSMKQPAQRTCNISQSLLLSLDLFKIIFSLWYSRKWHWYWMFHINYYRVRELSFILTFLILESENVPNIKAFSLLIHEFKQLWGPNCKLVGCCQCPIAHAILNPKC